MSRLVSVILPTRNRAHLLPRAVESILRQTTDDLELIVVDDGSDDETPMVLARFAAADSRLRVERTEVPIGAGAARNVGILCARGSYVAFNDDDDESLPNRLERQIALLNETPDAGVAFCPYVFMDSSGRAQLMGRPPATRIPLRRLLLRGNFLGTSCVVVRRELLVSIGGFDGQLPVMEDWDLWLRLAAVTHFAMTSEPLVVRYYTTGSLSTQRDRVLAAGRRLIEKLQRNGEVERDELADVLNAIGHIFMLEGAVREAREALFRSVRLRAWPPRQVARALMSQFGRSAYVVFTRLSEAIQRAAAPLPPAPHHAQESRAAVYGAGRAG